MSKKVKIKYVERTSSPAIKNLKEEIETIKLSKELTRLKDENKQVKPASEEDSVKKRIESLQEAKGKLGGGFRNFLRKANINSQINQQRQFIKEKQRSRNIDVTTTRLNQQAKLIEAQNRVNQLRKTNQVDFNSTLPFQTQKKQIKFEDLF
jgi:hypothetical protein